MGILALVVFVIGFIIALKIVNKGQQLYMKMLGIDQMFFSVKSKMVIIFIVWVIVTGLLYSPFMVIFGA